MSEDNSNIVFVGQTPILPVEKKWGAGESIWVDGLSILGTGDVSDPFRVNGDLFVKYEEIPFLIKELPLLTSISIIADFDPPLPVGRSVFCKIDAPYIFEITQLLTRTTDVNGYVMGTTLSDPTFSSETFNSGLWFRVYAGYSYLAEDSGRLHTTATAGRQEGLLAEVFGGFMNGNPINCMALPHGYFISNPDYPMSNFEGVEWSDPSIVQPNDNPRWLPKMYYYKSNMGRLNPPYSFPHGDAFDPPYGQYGARRGPRYMFVHIKNVGTSELTRVEFGIEMLIKDNTPGPVETPVST